MARCRALSLVEVLVLLCVAGLLAAVVLPAVARQRAAVRADECAMHLRTIGQAWHVFADDFEGRGPGHADNPQAQFTPHRWQAWLNHFVWGEELVVLNEYMRPIQQYNGWHEEYGEQLEAEAGEDNLACPEIGNWDEGIFARPYIANMNAVGGPGWVSPPYPHGQRMHQHPFHPHAQVWLGTRIDAFHRPAARFMVFEADRGNDQDPYRLAERDLLEHLDDETRSTRLLGGVGTYMFRHPNITMNVVMMDGRVHRVTNDPAMFGPERFSVE